ncbi:kinase-like domain-containing protein [Roridomyces roridus]|uniref:Kinase-like domain-containing protein n=1 Tax=Roridomyces roridus TaxID=1738132 RepID=A0AAD7BB27_9AGAR|nr:kinase-like domain-containing protein [Roridomyces roridus]
MSLDAVLDAVLDAILDISPIPGLSLAFHTLQFIVNCIQQVSESRRQLEELAKCVAQLLANLNAEFTAARLVESTSAGALRDLDSLVKDIQKFVQKEQERGFFKALLHQDARISGIDDFYRRIGTIVNSFQIAALWNVQTALEIDREARREDTDALTKRLKNLEKNQAELRRVLDVNQHNMMAMMVSIERKLASQRVERMSTSQQTFYFHALQYLTVLSGRPVRVEDWMITSFEVDFGKEVGSGGFGRVHRGTWNDTEVAIKVMRNVAGITPRAELLRQEIQIWSTLRHPHILQFLGANTLDEQPFIVMPYIPYTARQFIHRTREYDPIYILRDISLGLEYLHLRTICHGDLKGVNVLVDKSNKALLCDFGLARVKADVTSRTAGMADNGAICGGSRNWMAPELFTGVPPSTRSDIYAFGMTIFELYTDQDPLCHIRNQDFMELVCWKDLRPSKPTNISRLTDAMWDLATSCWAKRGSDRPTARKVHGVIAHLKTEVNRRHAATNDPPIISPTPVVPLAAVEVKPRPPPFVIPVVPTPPPPPAHQRRVTIVEPSSPPILHLASKAKSHVLRLSSGCHYIRFIPIEGPIPFNGSYVDGPVVCKLAEGLTSVSFGRDRAFTSDLTHREVGVLQNQQNMEYNAKYHKEISPVHAEICVVPGPRFLIRDCSNSSGGTFLNDSRLPSLSRAAELHNGDKVRLGCGVHSIMMRVEFLPRHAPVQRVALHGPMQPPVDQNTQKSQNAPLAMESRLQGSLLVQLVDKSSQRTTPSFGSILCRIIDDAPTLHIRRWDPADTETEGLFFLHPTVSRDHAGLRFQDGCLLVRDTCSANGTFLNGNKVATEHWTMVEDGDVLELQDPGEQHKGGQGVVASVRIWEISDGTS